MAAGCSSPVSYTPRSGPQSDARISYPLNSEVDTIPAWAAVFAPIMMLLLTVLVGEFLTSRREHANITQAVATAIYFFLDGVQVGMCGMNLCWCKRRAWLCCKHQGSGPQFDLCRCHPPLCRPL